MPRWKAGIHIPTLDAEKARAPKDDALHEAALPLDLAAIREATGRNVRAIDAIIVFDVSDRMISHLRLWNQGTNLSDPTNAPVFRVHGWEYQYQRRDINNKSTPQYPISCD